VDQVEKIRLPESLDDLPTLAAEIIAMVATLKLPASEHREAESEGYVTVEPEIPVYTDLSVGYKGREEIGSSGFEPLTPTVSR
jgi:hypothetical protein